MTDTAKKRPVDINRPTPRYPLIIIGGFIFLCLAAVAYLSVQNAAWATLIIAVFAIAAGVAYIYFNSVGRPAALEHRLDWQPALIEVQKQSLTLEVEGIAESLQQEPWESTDLFMAYVVAEDLALRQVQQEHSAPMIRHLQVGGTPFGALIVEPNELICVEVSFVVSPDLRQDKVDAMLRKAGTVRRFLATQKLDVELKLLIVVVTQLTPDEVTELRSRLSDRFPDSPVNIDIHFLDFEELQRRFVDHQ